MQRFLQRQTLRRNSYADSLLELVRDFDYFLVTPRIFICRTGEQPSSIIGFGGAPLRSPSFFSQESGSRVSAMIRVSSSVPAELFKGKDKLL